MSTGLTLIIGLAIFAVGFVALFYLLGGDEE